MLTVTRHDFLLELLSKDGGSFSTQRGARLMLDLPGSRPYGPWLAPDRADNNMPRSICFGSTTRVSRHRCHAMAISSPLWLQVYTGQPSAILCSDTKSFRKLCRTQVQQGDSVIDIGASYGASTQARCPNKPLFCSATVPRDRPSQLPILSSVHLKETIQYSCIHTRFWL